MVKETDIMFVRHTVQNKKFMSSLDDIPEISIIKLSEYID